MFSRDLGIGQTVGGEEADIVVNTSVLDSRAMTLLSFGLVEIGIWI